MVALAPSTASLFPQDKLAHFGEEQPRRDWDWDGGQVPGAGGLQAVHEGLFLFSRLFWSQEWWVILPWKRVPEYPKLEGIHEHH